MLKEKFQTLSRDALRSKDTETRRIMGSILARFLETEKAPGFKGWSEELELDVVRAHIKALQKSIEAMPGSAVAEGYTREIEMLGAYLPRMMDEAQTRAAVAPYAEKAAGKLGPFMGLVMKDLKGQVDPAILRKVAAELGLK